MKTYCQIRPDGTIAQISQGYENPPFSKSALVPEEIADKLLRYPKGWVYDGTSFIEVEKEPVIVDNKPSMEQRINELEMALADLFAGNI
ncbi:hypothetical protein [Brevibacillus choshinensis]|uniref:Uncharacterized protein n=1 Tax=Brevibacillus choshinensis TaxID=54911 RepID=A0ABX7FPL0_BRECH|nr:hypothetical protein [Brevibacillus choshinensis]QRG66925.1 hypothetical protein JNE38_26180 [Brevibacillus choshinensis]